MKQLKINKVFQDLIPPLSAEELKQLEDNVLAHGIRDAIVVWNDTIVDGHNRYKLAQDHALDFSTVSMEFDSEDSASLWIIDNQMGRRNLIDFVKFILLRKKQTILNIQGKKIMSVSAIDRGFAGNQYTKVDGLSQSDKPSKIEPAHNTQKQIAEALGWSTGKTAECQYLDTHAPADIIKQLIADEISISKAYDDLKKTQKAEALSIRKLRETTEEKKLDIDLNYDVKHGDVWKLGKHTLICGDGHQYKDHKIDAIITDPPYGINYEPDWKKSDGSENNFRQIFGDANDFNPLPFIDVHTVVLFGANYYAKHLPVGSWICWDKRVKDEADSMFGSPFELAWFKARTTSRSAIMIRVMHGGLVNADLKYGYSVTRSHPTQKPILLFEDIINQLTLPQDIICDPFCGSGTTLLAAENTGRTCIAYEIEPDYCSTILARFQSLTNIQPWKLKE